MTDNGLSGKRCLVTGAAGFIGSHLVERLLDEGAEVTALVRYNAAGSRGLIEALPLQDRQKIRIVWGDLRNTDCLDEAFEGQEIVFHLAAIIAIPFSYIRPEQLVDNNITATLNVLAASRRHNVARVVTTSSSEVYGTAQRVPIDESHPLEAQSPYAATKISCDKLAQAYHLSFGLPVVTIRPFNTYGPRQSARAIIPTIITQALTRQKVYLGAVHPTRDLNYVADTVDGFIRVATTPGVEGKTFNIGSGTEISIGDVADRIIRLIDKEIPVIFDATRIRPATSEVGRLICDSSRARAELGWHPAVDLDEGLKRTIEWIGQNLDAYRPEEYSI